MNLLGFLNGTIHGARPQYVLSSLRILKWEHGAVACHILADLNEWVIAKFGPDPRRIRLSEHLRQLAADATFCGEWAFTPEQVANDAEQFALNTAFEAAEFLGRVELQTGAPLGRAVAVTERAYEDAWRNFAGIMRRYLLPDTKDVLAHGPEIAESVRRQVRSVHLLVAEILSL